MKVLRTKKIDKKFLERGMIVELPAYKLEPGSVKGGKKFGRYQVIVLGVYDGYLHALEIAGRPRADVIAHKDVDLFAKKFGIKHIYALGKYVGVDIPKIDFRRSARRVYTQVIKKRLEIKVGYRTFIFRKLPRFIHLQDVGFGSDVMRNLYPKPGDKIKLLSGELATITSGYPVMQAKKSDGTTQTIKHHIKLTDDAGRPTFLETKGFKI